MEFILGFVVGMATMAIYAAARIRKLIPPRQPRYIRATTREPVQ